MTMSKIIARASVSALALTAIAPAFAQSTGQQLFDQPEIVVTGAHNTNGVGGVRVENTSKARAVLTQEFIKRQIPGQSIDDIINYMPGVSFQNNDPYGSSGGTLTIHGFDASRISQTWDGVPLNDSGNYALYSNQQLDMELISEVNVSLGSTDIDSPTAAASGSTVNYVTRNPTEDFHVRLEGSMGQYDYMRLFGVVDTGTFTPFGTRAFIAASRSSYNNPYFRQSSTDKLQLNGKVYQPIGSNGDFVSVGANFNRNINRNFSSVPLRVDGVDDGSRVVGSGSGNRFPVTKDEREYTIAPCITPAGVNGAIDTNVCGTPAYDLSYNPSKTGNVRINSKFTLADNLVLTVDPSWQFVSANGGNGAVKGYEGVTPPGSKTVPAGLTGYIGGSPYFGGVDLNGDGDTLDAVELYAPSQTRTNRFGLIANLQWNITPTQTVRVNYSWDHARHRQTGEVAALQANGITTNPFPYHDPLLDANGLPIEKRNRLSYAILNQVAGQYRGEFLDSKLVVNAGVRAPFFTRNLDQRCVTEAGGKGYIDCFNDAADQDAFLAANTTATPPQKRTLHYNKVLPAAGFTYNFTPQISAFGDYSKGLQVPGTDNLYNSFSFAADSDAAHPKAETTDNFNLGLRFRSSKIQAQLSGWYTNFKNRLASSYDPVEDITVYRNLGTVHKYGIDGSISYQPIQQISLYAFGSYLKSKILDNVEATATTVYNTAGKRESGSPTYTFGARAQGNFGPVTLGIQAKRTGPRYVNDQNIPIYNTTHTAILYGAKTPAYTLVDLDARVSLKGIGLNDGTYLQLNVTNLFDKLYVGGFSGNTSETSVPYAYIGSPRAISGTVNFAF
ncbi:TonB-dependent receptor [Sphingomonas oryzagri]|uniref:TonB-dependent receptor n=1 Tax=Sphingomonas oryzagri TaxID=3042314 RepID=A0ABT6N112_9SPHN|nr:TonB-dependent receptor [Sphingomonas oryzagri]MDH7638993.1 TonB-dependent receptor [Sphingomonas oryzagri]